jgi:hypothetical protein
MTQTSHIIFYQSEVGPSPVAEPLQLSARAAWTFQHRQDSKTDYEPSPQNDRPSCPGKTLEGEVRRDQVTGFSPCFPKRPH